MVNRKVKRLLLDKLKITPQALSHRAKVIKTHYGPMSTDEAVYVVAHQEGIDLSRHLPIQVIDRVRSLVPKELPKPTTTPISKRAKVRRPKRAATSAYPLVKDSMIARSVDIGNESFPQMFVLENSIRTLIINKLTKAYGSDWWNKARIKGIRDNVQKTIDKEKKYPHREKRGLHPIFYSNFADVIIDFQWFEVEMDQVYMARNSLAHSVLISDDDASTIRLFYRNWARLLESAGIK